MIEIQYFEMIVVPAELHKRFAFEEANGEFSNDPSRIVFGNRKEMVDNTPVNIFRNLIRCGSANWQGNGGTGSMTRRLFLLVDS